jgi:hypothetical protein
MKTPSGLVTCEDIESGEMAAYAAKLRSYTTEELKDIYAHIHILRHPLRYKLLLRELEARGLAEDGLSPPAARSEIVVWLSGLPFFARYSSLTPLAAALLLLSITAAATLTLLLPIWLFEQPLDFKGIQAAIVYLVYAPVAVACGASSGVRLGGRGVYFLWVLAGVVLGGWVFALTGTPADIWRSLTEPQGTGGGFNIGGF